MAEANGGDAESTKSTESTGAGSPPTRAGAPARDRELRARGRATMQRLLDGGMRVFARRGYHAARVDDIVKAAKTSHGTFYLYFSNKEDLFRILTQQVSDDMEGLAEALGELTPDERGYQELRAWMGRFSDVYERFGPMIGAWTEAETADDEAGRIGTDLLGRFTAALAGRIAASDVRDLDAGVAALALVAMIERYHYYALTGLVGPDRDAVVDTLASVTHASLFGRRAVSG